jgi:outer membrane lipoprotein
MGGTMAKWFFPVLAFFLAVYGCATVIPKESLKSADLNLTFQQLQRDPEQYRGKVVLLGGQILSSKVQSNETWVEVLQRPLSSGQKPQNTDVSYGRFIVHFPDFRDPAVYAPGRQITILGEVQGREVLPLDGTTYAYPLLAPREAYLWRPPEPGSGPLINFGFGIGGVFR